MIRDWNLAAGTMQIVSTLEGRHWEARWVIGSDTVTAVQNAHVLLRRWVVMDSS